MRKIRFNILRTVIILLSILSFFSCSKDDDLSNLKDTLIVRHKDADMPAYIYGNASEKIFLITLHGGPGGLGLGFRGKAFNEIENNYGVVYFDQRGAGMAQGNYNEDGISLDIMAEDVLALVQVMKRKYGSDSRFYLMGHSWGGILGTATVLKNQDAFLGWIPVDGNHNPSDIYSEYIANFERVAAVQIAENNSVEFWESIQDLISTLDPDTFNQDDLFKLNSKAHQGERILEDDGVVNGRDDDDSENIIFEYNLLTFYWNLLKSSSILDDQGIWENVTFADQLPEIKIPALILWGEHDLIVPPRFAQEAYDNIGSSVKKLVIFEHSGHGPMGSEPNLFASEVIQFMDENK